MLSHRQAGRAQVSYASKGQVAHTFISGRGQLRRALTRALIWWLTHFAAAQNTTQLMRIARTRTLDT